MQSRHERSDFFINRKKSPHKTPIVLLLILACAVAGKTVQGKDVSAWTSSGPKPLCELGECPPRPAGCTHVAVCVGSCSHGKLGVLGAWSRPEP